MSQVPEIGQVWELELYTPQNEKFHSIVLVLRPIDASYGGLSGLDLMDGSRIRLLMPHGDPLPNAWKRIA